MERSYLSRNAFRTSFVLLLVVAVSLLFLAVIWPFAKALLMGALLAGLCRPFYRWNTRWLGGRKSLAALMTLLILVIVAIGPVTILAGLVVHQAATVSDDALPWLQTHFGPASSFNIHDWLVRHFPSLASYIPEQSQIIDNIARVAKSAGSYLVSGATQVTAGIAGFVLDVFVMLYAMFYFLRDGRAILERIIYYTPLSHPDEELILERLSSVTRATIKGTLVIGVIQGALGGIGFWVAGIEGAAFWGVLMTVFSVVPGIGSTVIWVPAVIYLYIAGHALAATLLLIWCAAIVGTIDNALRPVLVGKDAKIPDLLILVGTLGGLAFFGAIGFIIGPLVCGVFLTVWDIYGNTFKDVLPAVSSGQAEEAHEPVTILPKKSEE